MNFISFLLNIVGYAPANLRKDLRNTHYTKSDLLPKIWMWALALMVFTSCSLTRNVENGEFLLNKVKVNVSDPNLNSDLNGLIKQKENRKILWIYRFKLRFYNSFLFKKDSESKLRNSLGEPPVIYDSTSAQNSVNQMIAFLKNRGYYSNEVSFEEKYRGPKSKKIKIIYHVKQNKPTIIAEISKDIPIPNILSDFNKSDKKSLLKVGDNFDIDVMEEERKRLTKAMQNEGYFFFSNDLIYYKADTSREINKVFITNKIKEDPIKFFGDSIQVKPYSTYRIRNVFVRQDFDEKLTGLNKNDTLNQWGYYFLNESSFSVKPKVISRSIFHSADGFYTLDNHENTYRRLTALNNFKYVNISYTKKGEDPQSNYLNCLISLAPNKPKTFSVETNGTTTGGILGINGTVSVSHRNTFRGAELLRLSIYGGLEAQAVKSGAEVIDNTPFNTVEFRPEISLVLPKFLLPVDQNTFAKRFTPRTTINFSYNYQRRPDYTRNILNSGLIYSWKESKTKSHAIQPVNLSQVKIYKSDDFAARLDSIDNSSLKASYEDNFITSFLYSFVLNDKILKKDTRYNILRANLEFAGNLIYTLDKYAFNTIPDENGQFKINNIPYSQFFRTYVEYIHNFYVNKANQFVNRTFIGVGIPYGNSSAMPFVRSFYGGGANGIRAWQARSLGPGSLSNQSLATANVDQIGDIKLETNLEYRFVIVKYLEGALFSDIGNIWVLSNEGYDEAAFFKFDKLWKDLAIGGGAGIRLNFDFFIIRLDVAKRMKDPGATDPFAVKFFYSDPAIYNFAIGYPF